MQRIFDLLMNIGNDKLLHFAMSAIISAVLVVVMATLHIAPAWVVSAVILAITILGIVKEFTIDKKADWRDIVANYAGAMIVLGAYLAAVL